MMISSQARAAYQTLIAADQAVTDAVNAEIAAMSAADKAQASLRRCRKPESITAAEGRVEAANAQVHAARAARAEAHEARAAAREAYLTILKHEYQAFRAEMTYDAMEPLRAAAQALNAEVKAAAAQGNGWTRAIAQSAAAYEATAQAASLLIDVPYSPVTTPAELKAAAQWATDNQYPGAYEMTAQAAATGSALMGLSIRAALTHSAYEALLAYRRALGQEALIPPGPAPVSAPVYGAEPMSPDEAAAALSAEATRAALIAAAQRQAYLVAARSAAMTANHYYATGGAEDHRAMTEANRAAAEAHEALGRADLALSQALEAGAQNRLTLNQMTVA